MPRSNKKKHFMKQEDPTSPSNQIASLLTAEKNLMLARAITSGRNHGINLEPGSSNPGLGDCAFEAVIQNNNDRSCFSQKFLMPISHYRQIWVTDMANRTVDSPWNIYSRKEWFNGWMQMQVPGTYERGIFGDLMLPGISCGIRKILLIFNTNPNSPHDPIYIVNPSQFNVRPDTDVPILLGYNQSHYESLHPSDQEDIQVTVNLVNCYQEGRYPFGRKDFPMLLGIENSSGVQNQIPLEKEKMKRKNETEGTSKHFRSTEKISKKIMETQMDAETYEEINLEDVDEFFDNFTKRMKEFSCPSSSLPPPSKKMKKQANNESTPEELLKEAEPDKLEEKPPQTRQKTNKQNPNKQNDSSEDDDDFQDKGKDEQTSKSVSQNVRKGGWTQ